MTPLLLAIDSAGFPARWLTWQEAIVDDVLGKFAYGFGDFEFAFRGGTNRETGLQSRVELKSILVLKGRTPEACKQPTIALTNEALFRRDRYICNAAVHSSIPIGILVGARRSCRTDQSNNAIPAYRIKLHTHPRIRISSGRACGRPSRASAGWLPVQRKRAAARS